MPDHLLDELRAIVGPSHVLTDDMAMSYCRDWTGRWEGSCTAVVRPATTAEVSKVTIACAAAGAPMVPQGGNTGLVGGSIPRDGGVVISLVRLDAVGPVDPMVGQLTAGAGATVSTVQQAASEAGWRYPVDFAARDTATIGGSIATNAGGHHVLRHGMTRRHVVGIEVVLADGRVVSHLGGLLKDNTGYDIGGLLCGSEGTLGIITAARLALIPEAGRSAVAMVGFATFDDAAAAVGPLRRRLPDVEAIELMCADGMLSIGEHIGATPPLGDCPVVLLIEVVSNTDPVTQLADGIDGLPGVTDSAVAVDSVAKANLWRWRDRHTEVINQAGPHPPHKFDVTLPLAEMSGFVDQVRREVAEHNPAARVWIFGHAGDGNLHVNVVGPAPDDDTIDELVLRLVASCSGSISAEHGIGRAKQPWLHLSRSPAEIATFTAIKAALDPEGLLNPGVLLPPKDPQRLS